jgi:hypothetical protein
MNQRRLSFRDSSRRNWLSARPGEIMQRMRGIESRGGRGGERHLGLGIGIVHLQQREVAQREEQRDARQHAEHLAALHARLQRRGAAQAAQHPPEEERSAASQQHSPQPVELPQGRGGTRFRSAWRVSPGERRLRRATWEALEMRWEEGKEVGHAPAAGQAPRCGGRGRARDGRAAAA